MPQYEHQMLCRIAEQPLTPVVDFGMQPLGNGFLTENEISNEYFFRLQLGFSEESTLLQLLRQPEPERMFHNQYPFFSGTSSVMGTHFQTFATWVIDSGFLGDDPFVVELGCNDGVMLKHFASGGIKHLGIEPAENVAEVANQNGVMTISEFFSESLAESVLERHGPADAILAANVLCHISDLRGVIKGFKKLLKPNGIIAFEDPYLGDIISKTSFDQIYDEHVFLFSAHSVQYAFSLEGIELIDVQAQSTHGGSMRYILANRGAHKISSSVEQTLRQEQKQGLHRIDTFDIFRINIEKSRKNILAELNTLKQRGALVAGYGATSKSTTILNFCGIGPDLVEFICDTTPLKQGKLSPGMHIPVVSHEFFQQNPPDVSILFAWNHGREIMSKESAYIEAGGKFLTHVPHVHYV